MRTKSTQNVIWKPTEPSSLKLSVSEARLWSAGSPCLQWRHSSITEGCFTNERRSTPSPSVTVFLAIISFLLVSIPLCSPSHCLACSRMWSERRTCQCYQHATDDSFEGDRDFQLLPLRLITHTPRWVDPHSPLCKTNYQAMGGHLTCWGQRLFKLCYDTHIINAEEEWVTEDVSI